MSIPKRTAFAISFLVFASARGIAQGTQPATGQDQDAAATIATLSEPLHFSGNESDAVKRYEGLDSATKRIEGTVDQYIGSAFDPNDTSADLQSRLRTVLSSHRPNPDYADPPFAVVANLRAGRSLVVAYTLVRGPHDDVATIRAYRSEGGRFEFQAATAEDFAGYNMFKAELMAPVRNELWLLVWGNAQTFNGTKVRCRVYTFDGDNFSTVWSPEDVFNAQVQATQDGFTIDHEVRNPPYTVHDQYRLTVDGPVKAN